MSFFFLRARWTPNLLAGIALLLAPAFLAAQVWTPLGPPGGTVTSLAVHPTDPRVLYGAGSPPGVIRTTDSGGSWQLLPGSPAWSFVTLDPTRPTTLYATSLFSTQVFRSTDGGAHWAVVSRTLALDVSPTFVAVDPARPARLYLATSSRGLWRSGDGGATWQAASQGPFAQQMSTISALAIPRKPAGTVIAGTGSGLFRTGDAGKTWQRLRSGVPAGFVRALVLAPSDPKVLYASISGAPGNGVYRSDDGGDSWRRVGDLNSFPVLTLTVLSQAPRTVLAATLDGTIFKSTDGGAHWTPRITPAGQTIVLAAGPGNAVYAGLAPRGTDFGGVLRSGDGGNTWTRVHRGIPGLEAVAVAVDPADPDVLITSVFGPGLFRTANGGVRWIRTAAGLPLLPPLQEGVAMVNVLATGPGTFYAMETTGQRGWRTTDAGFTWSPLPGLPGFVVLLEADPIAPATLYAVAQDNTTPALFRSGDGGSSWDRVSALPAFCTLDGLTVDHTTASAPAVIYVTGSRSPFPICRAQNLAAVLRSPDGGATWTSADAGLPAEAVRKVVVDRQDSRVLYAGLGANLFSLPYGLWKSTDSGATWQALGLGDQVITALAASPIPGQLWAGTRSKVFRSDDAGATWRDWSGGWTLTILDFTFDPHDPHRLYAAGLGGVWRLEEQP